MHRDSSYNCTVGSQRRGLQAAAASAPNATIPALTPGGALIAPTGVSTTPPSGLYFTPASGRGLLLTYAGAPTRSLADSVTSSPCASDIFLASSGHALTLQLTLGASGRAGGVVCGALAASQASPPAFAPPLPLAFTVRLAATAPPYNVSAPAPGSASAALYAPLLAPTATLPGGSGSGSTAPLLVVGAAPAAPAAAAASRGVTTTASVLQALPFFAALALPALYPWPGSGACEEARLHAHPADPR